jgi:hypothetical protein
MVPAMHSMPLPVERMIPLPDLFWHRSTLHGQGHVARVMVHAMRLIEATGQREHATLLWASVFLHDLARHHDGVCHVHGAAAARRLRTEEDLQRRIAEAGLAPEDYPAIAAAVTAHSAPKEVSRAHAHWPLIALLKDADGLDRVRIGDLDLRYLRHSEARGMAGFAQALLERTSPLPTGPDLFQQVWQIASSLDETPRFRITRRQ